MNSVRYTITWFIRLAAAVVLSFFLFTAVSLLHAAFGHGNKNGKIPQARRIEAAELIRKPPEEKKVAALRVRQMQAPAAQGRASQGQFDMRFAPDLSVDAAATGGAGVALQKQELAAEIFDEGQVDEQAIPEFTPPIPYPERAVEQGISGQVEVVFVITYQGKVSDIQVVRTPSPLFVNDVRRGVAAWRYKPAKKKGIPVNQRYRRVIEFNLQ
jgi:protein TonB